MAAFAVGDHYYYCCCHGTRRGSSSSSSSLHHHGKRTLVTNCILLLRLVLAIISMLLHGPVILSSLSEGYPAVAAQQQLTSSGSAINPYGSNRIYQMAYDPTNRTLYLTSYDRHTIIQCHDASTASLQPSNATAWSYAIVAGTDYRAGFPGLQEAPPGTALFTYPSGVVGWPQYAVGPYSYRTTTTTTGTNNTNNMNIEDIMSSSSSSSSSSWVGLWVVDSRNHALRFIHFARGRNVTLVAGSSVGKAGATDGIGKAALLFVPGNVAWGRFLQRTIVDDHADELLLRTPPPPPPSGEKSPPSLWTSVLYWPEERTHCVRQGVPLRNGTSPSFFQPATMMMLQDMVLNVSTFAGFCDVNTHGKDTGLVYNRTGMFYGPWGVAMFVPPTSTTAPLPPPPPPPGSTTVLFIGDNGNHRLIMIAPMYPAYARTTTAIFSIPNGLCGVTVARLRKEDGSSMFSGGLLPDSSSEIVVVEVAVGHWYCIEYINASIALWYNTSSNSTVLLPAATRVTILASTGIFWTENVIFLRYTPNSTFNGTLVVFSGETYTERFYTSLEYYCCLDLDYSAPLELQDGGGLLGVPYAPTMTSTGTDEFRRSTTSSTSSKRTISSRSHGRASSSISSSLLLFIHRRHSSNIPAWYPHPSKSITTTVVPTPTRTTAVHRPRLSWTVAGGASLRRSHDNSSSSSKITSHSVPPLGPSTWAATKATTAAAMTVSTMVPGAASKSAVLGRASMVWQCGAAAGPAAAAANDPQQFLSFGAALGSSDDGAVRGALVITSLLRVVMVVVSLIIVITITEGAST